MKGRRKILTVLIISLILNIPSVFAQNYTIKEPINRFPAFSLDTNYQTVEYCSLKEYYVDITWDDLYFNFETNDKEFSSQYYENNLFTFNNNSFSTSDFQYYRIKLNENINDNLSNVVVENKSCFALNVNATINYNSELKIANKDDNNLIFGKNTSRNNLFSKEKTSFIVKSKLHKTEKILGEEIKLTFTKN